MNQDNTVANVINGKSYNAGGGLIDPQNVKTNTAIGGGQKDTAITSEKMKPTKPFTLPQQKTDTTNAQVSGFIDASTQANKNKMQTDVEKMLAEQQATKESTSKDLKMTLQDILGTNTEIANAPQTIDYTAQNKASEEATRWTNAIEAEALSARRATEFLAQNNPQGLYGGALQDEVQRINRDSLIKQADMAILQNAALRNYETAANIADRQLELKVAPLKAKLENLKFFYENNKADFNKADDRLYADAVKKADAELKRKQDIEAQITELKKNVAQYAGSNASSVLSKLAQINTDEAGAIDKALAVAGQYGGDVLGRKLQQAQLSKIYTDIAKSRAEINQGVISNVNNSPYKQSLDIVLASSKFSKDQKADLINAVNNGQNPVTVLKNQAKSILGSAEATKLTGLEVAKSQMDNLKNSLDAYYRNGGKTNVFKGGYEKTINKLGKVEEPELVSIATEISTALQSYRNAVSGTAYSVQEGAEIASVFPGINKSQGLNDAIIKGRKNAMESTIDSYYATPLGDVYYQLKNAEVDPLGVIKNESQVSENNPLGL